jgi:hypothetical protein
MPSAMPEWYERMGMQGSHNTQNANRRLRIRMDLCDTTRWTIRMTGGSVMCTRGGCPLEPLFDAGPARTRSR